MDGNIFGSVMDLGALLGDGGLEGSIGDTDAFLKDLGDAELEPFELPKDFPAKTSSHTSSLSGVTGYDASNDEAETFRSAIPTMQFPQQFPTVQMWPTYPPMSMSAPPALKQSVSDNSSPNTAALLSQLLAAIKTNVAEQPDVQPKQEAFPVQSVPQQVVPKSAENMTVPSLTAQQQSALQTIMSLGSLGSTPEGKKVRRMLSNRESARRSRHRKQAHVHTLEERVIAMETENQRLKADLNRLTEQQVLHVNERLELQAEIGNLRKKIAQMEHAGSCGMPVKVEAAGSGASNKGGSLSSDSCCASKPGTRQALPIEPEHCSKKRRV